MNGEALCRNRRRFVEAFGINLDGVPEPICVLETDHTLLDAHRESLADSPFVRLAWYG